MILLCSDRQAGELAFFLRAIPINVQLYEMVDNLSVKIERDKNHWWPKFKSNDYSKSFESVLYSVAAFTIGQIDNLECTVHIV
jgi:hypothetical protein